MVERSTPAGVVRSVAALAAYVALAVLLFANTWTNPGGGWIGYDGDADSTMWSIQWVAFAAIHQLNPFLTNYIFYPEGLNILWANADAPVALGWATLPITLAFGPIVTYNVLQTLALGLSAWTAFIAIRAIVTRTAAAFVGGLVYGFGPYMLSQAYGHLGLSFAVVPPLLLWLLYRLLVRRDISPVAAGAVAGVLVAFQLLVAAELVVTELIVTVGALVWIGLIALVLRLPTDWRSVLRRLAISGLVSVVVFGLLAGYPLYTLLRGPGRITQGPVRAFGVYVTDLMSLVVPNGQTQALHNDWTVNLSRVFPGGTPEAGGYLGVTLLALVLFTFIRWFRNPPVLFAAGMLAFTVLMSLGPNLVYDGQVHHSIHLPWRVFRDVPFVNEVLPERLALYFDLFAALLLAMFIDKALHAPSRLSRSFGVVATVLALVPLAPSWPWINSAAHVPSVFQPGAADNRSFTSVVPDGSVIVILPADLPAQGYGYSMLWQAYDRDGFLMPEGDLLHGESSGKATNDPALSPLWNAIVALQSGAGTTDADVSAVQAQLAAYHVRAIVVGPMPHEPLAVDYFTLVVGVPPTDVGDVHIWYLAGP